MGLKHIILYFFILIYSISLVFCILGLMGLFDVSSPERKLAIYTFVFLLLPLAYAFRLTRGMYLIGGTKGVALVLLGASLVLLFILIVCV